MQKLLSNNYNSPKHFLSVKVCVANKTDSRNVLLHRNQSIINKGGLSSVLCLSVNSNCKVVGEFIPTGSWIPLLASVSSSMCSLSYPMVTIY